MIPIADENPTLRTPVATIGILLAMGFVWVVVQDAGFSAYTLAASICNLGLVPGEITGRAPVGMAIPIASGLSCVVDRESVNWLTPFISIFLHAGWLHLLGNALFFWVFGNNVEDVMGRMRFVVFYLICGLAASAAQVAVNPASPVPTVGASGAISGVMGAYLVLFPRVRVKMLFPLLIIFPIIAFPAWAVLIWWFASQLLSGLPEMLASQQPATGGVAFWAHVGGFVAGVSLVRPFENPVLVGRRRVAFAKWAIPAG